MNLPALWPKYFTLGDYDCQGVLDIKFYADEGESHLIKKISD